MKPRARKSWKHRLASRLTARFRRQLGGYGDPCGDPHDDRITVIYSRRFWDHIDPDSRGEFLSVIFGVESVEIDLREPGAFGTRVASACRRIAGEYVRMAERLEVGQRAPRQGPADGRPENR